MDQVGREKEDLRAQLELRRARLRAVADDLLDAIEVIEKPKSFTEAERAARAVMANDKMMTQLYGAPLKSGYNISFEYPPRYDDDRASSSSARYAPCEDDEDDDPEDDEYEDEDLTDACDEDEADTDTADTTDQDTIETDEQAVKEARARAIYDAYYAAIKAEKDSFDAGNSTDLGP
jgi:hypothetical protein